MNSTAGFGYVRLWLCEVSSLVLGSWLGVIYFWILAVWVVYTNVCSFYLLNFIFSPCFPISDVILTFCFLFFVVAIFVVYQSNCTKFTASSESKLIVCNWKDFEALSAKFVRLAVHVLLPFPPLVSWLLHLHQSYCTFD